MKNLKISELEIKDQYKVKDLMDTWNNDRIMPYPVTIRNAYSGEQQKVSTFDLGKQVQIDLIERIQDELISVLEGDEFDKGDIINYLKNLKPIEYEVKEQTHDWEHMESRATIIDMSDTQVKNPYTMARLNHTVSGMSKDD